MSKTKTKEVPFNPSEKIIAIQSSICGLKKDAKNPYHKSNYMSLSQVVNNLKPILYKHDCYSSHELGLSDNEKPFLATKIVYKDGSVLLQCKSPLPVKDSGDPQKLGSAITYMRRYNLTALLELEEDDDDGNGATQPATKQNQFQKLNNAASGEMEATLKAANEKMFDTIKTEIKDCEMMDSLALVWQENASSIAKLRKYMPELFAELQVLKDRQKEKINL